MVKLGSLIQSISLRLRTEPTMLFTMAMIHYYRNESSNESPETPSSGKEGGE